MADPPHRSARPATSPIRFDDRSNHVVATLQRDLHSVGVARGEVARFLRAAHVASAQIESATLVVSELVTNALRYGLGDVVVRCSRANDGDVHVAVTDSGTEQPVMLPPDPERIGGVGLRIVDRLSSAWGVAPFPGGKTVWATVGAGAP